MTQTRQNCRERFSGRDSLRHQLWSCFCSRNWFLIEVAVMILLVNVANNFQQRDVTPPLAYSRS